MSKILLMLALLAVVLAVAGCQTETGSREYSPGKGWVPTPTE